MDEYTKAANELRKDNDKTAGMAGAGAGVLAGAQVGTVLLPIPVVGTFTGALVGGLIGTKIGKKVGGVLLDKMAPAEQAFTSGSTAGAPGSGKVDVAAELAKLADLRAAGVLDEDEFRAAKAKLLGL